MEHDGAELACALREAREEDGVLTGWIQERGRLEGLDCSDLEFQQGVFRGCQFFGCDFSYASFYGTVFQSCRWVDCRFPKSVWRDASLADCRGDGASFQGSRWKGGAIRDCILRYANFRGCTWEKLAVSGSDLREAALAEARLIQPVLCRVDFTGAEFFHTPLRGIDLSACDIEGISVSETCAELRGAKIDLLQASVVASLMGVIIAERE